MPFSHIVWYTRDVVESATRNNRSSHRAINGAGSHSPIWEVMTMRFLSREEGQGLVEYALILVLVAIVVLVILALLGPTIGEYTNIVIDFFRELLGSS